MTMNFTREELLVIQNALLYYRTHGCGFNGEEYRLALNMLARVSAKIYTGTNND